MARPTYTDEQLSAAVNALSSPARIEQAQRLVEGNAPALQGILQQALDAAEWFGSAHQAELAKAAGNPDPDERLAAVRELLSQETSVSMLIGVAVGFEIAHELMSDTQQEA